VDGAGNGRRAAQRKGERLAEIKAEATPVRFCMPVLHACFACLFCSVALLASLLLRPFFYLFFPPSLLASPPVSRKRYRSDAGEHGKASMGPAPKPTHFYDAIHPKRGPLLSASGREGTEHGFYVGFPREGERVCATMGMPSYQLSSRS